MSTKINTTNVKVFVDGKEVKGVTEGLTLDKNKSDEEKALEDWYNNMMEQYPEGD